MGALTTTALGGMLALSAGLLLGCGGSDNTSSGGSNSPVLSDAETLVGAALLPPDGVVSAADALGSEDLPPDSASAVIADDDLPPAG